MRNLFLAAFLLFIISTIISCGNGLKKRYFKHPEKITELNLVDQKYTNFPMEVLEFANLKSLNLSFNQIDQIPTEIAGLQKLESLNLNNNRLNSLPASLSRLTSLKYLSLVNNQITDLPFEIAYLPNLKYLNLANNQFTLETLEKIEKLLPNTKIIFDLRELSQAEAFYFEQSQVFLQNKDTLRSLIYLDKAIRAKPDYAVAYTSRGVIKFYLNDKFGACSDFQTASGLGDRRATELFMQYCK
jgi:Leucine-rich repeat (LRR) protein